MDIIIKSFNRPYYLERCIRSIYKYVVGDFTIKILDDGTAPEYLEKVKSLFPDVTIVLSPYYEEKWKAIKDHVTGKKKFQPRVIPSRFWFKQISSASSTFLLLEDDIWLTGPINLEEVGRVMSHEQFVLLRLFWQGNKKFVKGERESISDTLEEMFPSIPWTNSLLLYNKLKLTSILYRLGIIKKEIYFQLPFYSLYVVAAAFFDKNYWLSLWEGAADKVEEPYQLKKAHEWFLNKKARYAKTVNEVAKTSYISSATGWFEDIHFDMSCFNHVLNQAWLEGKMDAMQNFPNDFTIDYLKPFLEASNSKECSFEEWQKWISRFKKGYRELGCITE